MEIHGFLFGNYLHSWWSCQSIFHDFPYLWNLCECLMEDMFLILYILYQFCTSHFDELLIDVEDFCSELFSIGLGMDQILPALQRLQRTSGSIWSCTKTPSGSLRMGNSQGRCCWGDGIYTVNIYIYYIYYNIYIYTLSYTYTILYLYNMFCFFENEHPAQEFPIVFDPDVSPSDSQVQRRQNLPTKTYQHGLVEWGKPCMVCEVLGVWKMWLDPLVPLSVCLVLLLMTQHTKYLDLLTADPGSLATWETSRPLLRFAFWAHQHQVLNLGCRSRLLRIIQLRRFRKGAGFFSVTRHEVIPRKSGLLVRNWPNELPWKMSWSLARLGIAFFDMCIRHWWCACVYRVTPSGFKHILPAISGFKWFTRPTRN